MGPITAKDVPDWSLEGVQRIRTTVHLCLVSYLLAIVGTRTVLGVDTARDLIVAALALSAAPRPGRAPHPAAPQRSRTTSAAPDDVRDRKDGP